jgi:curved DNA-binding protein CbpA
MTEDFLHYVWKFRLFDMNDLKTDEGEDLMIVKTGEHNSHAGADFFNSKIKIGTTLWAGNVEIHLQTDDWNKHNHQHDKAYNNVILHVVYDSDSSAIIIDKRLIPVLELKGKIKRKIWDNYEELIENKDWIPCEKQIKTVDRFTIDNWLERILIERLERKTGEILTSLNQNNNNWEETFYRYLAKNFGYKINALPFELLAKSIPNSILAKHKDNINQIEALLFGQAGMLNDDLNDEYYNRLKKEYEFLKHKHNLLPIDESLWKFLRLRPVGFPSVRIAQFAQLINHSSHLFSKVLEVRSTLELSKLFNVATSDYWDEHYTFGKNSVTKSKHLGKDFINNIIINTIVPFLFVYGKKKGENKQADKAFRFLEELAPEKNSILTKWKEIGIVAKNSYQSQALLELKNEYCLPKKCLTCSIGNKILNRHE